MLKGSHHSEETKQRISEALKGKRHPFYGRPKEEHSMYGKHHSKETRKKTSEALKGRKRPPFSEEWKRNISTGLKAAGIKGKIPWNRGKKLPPFSEEHRRRISEAKKGARSPWYGKHLSKEIRRRMSEAKSGKRNPMFGRHHSRETRMKMSERQRGEKHWKWKGGCNLYYGPDWRHQRRLVRERDNYTCICGLRENGREHDVHHLVPYRISKDNSRDNLWTLCRKCHIRIETIIEEATGTYHTHGD